MNSLLNGEIDSDDKSEYIPVVNTFPKPHVKWFSPAGFHRRFGYPHDDPSAVVRNEVLEEIERERSLTLTTERLEAFRRIAQLWNGKLVGPNDVHLLLDKVPSWNELLGDIEQHHLEDFLATVRAVDQEYVDAFGHYDWFTTERQTPGWVKTTYIARCPARYDIEERARTLINGRKDLPDLHGDPHEGLKHRFGVGCEAVRATVSENRDVETYASVNGYTVDLLERDGVRTVMGEVLTHHNNNQLYRSTIKKLQDLNHPAILIFDARSTLRRVFNHWHDHGIDVPGAPFFSAPRMDWLQEQCYNAAHDYNRDWVVEDVFTITQLWDLIFEENPVPTHDEVMNVIW